MSHKIPDSKLFLSISYIKMSIKFFISAALSSMPKKLKKSRPKNKKKFFDQNPQKIDLFDFTSFLPELFLHLLAHCVITRGYVEYYSYLVLSWIAIAFSVKNVSDGKPDNLHCSKAVLSMKW